jgi:transcription initiation factor TFIID subunit 12
MADNGIQNRPQQPAPTAQGSLIRAEQVKKLPHLREDQKAQQEVFISKLWDMINNSPQGSEQHTKAYARLSAISTTMMQDMKKYHALKRQQQQQQATQGHSQAQPQVGVNAQGQPFANPPNNQMFGQLNPAIQQRVNEQHFYYPPQMVEGTKAAEEWLREAKARFGQALSRSEVAKSKMREFQISVQNRQKAGNPLSASEEEIYKNKLQQCQKAITESSSFMEKFREQQAQFQRQQPQQRFANQPMVNQMSDSNEASASANMQSAGGTQGPQGHTIDSALSAARESAVATQNAGSPTGVPAQTVQSSTPVTGQFPQPSPYNNQDAHNQISGPPRPHSQQGIPGMHQNQPYNGQAPPSATHAHPPGLNTQVKKEVREPISKTLNVADPKPVVMPASRPTLTGGPGVGMGQMAQPAIPMMPGYVLESSEDGRLLSKKKLNDLVREVTGPGGEEQLTPEVEEVCIFVFILPLTSPNLTAKVTITRNPYHITNIPH